MTGSAKVLASYAYPTPISWGSPHLEIYCPGKANGSNSVYRKYRSLDAIDTTFNPPGDALEWVGGPMADYETSIAAIARSESQFLDVLLPLPCCFGVRFNVQRLLEHFALRA